MRDNTGRALTAGRACCTDGLEENPGDEVRPPGLMEPGGQRLRRVGVPTTWLAARGGNEMICLSAGATPTICHA